MAVVDLVQRRLLDLGYSPAGVAGILGNLQQESTFNPTAVGSAGEIGLAQWKGSRADALKAFAGARDWREPTVQADFIHHELGRDYPQLQAQLKSATDPQGAALSFGKTYERPSEQFADWAKRQKYAGQYLAQAGTKEGGAPAKPVPFFDAVEQATRSTAQAPVSFVDALGGEAPIEQGSWFGEGFRSGLLGLRETGIALKGLAQKAVGDREGLLDTVSVLESLGRTQSVLQPAYPTLEETLAKGTVVDFFDWATHRLGEQAPNLMLAIAGGGLGALAGRYLGRLVAERAISETVAQQALASFAKRGAITGAYLTSAGLETGSTAQEQATAVGDVNIPVALGAGAVKGALEMATPLLVVKRLGLAGPVAEGLLKRIEGSLGGRVVEGVLTEGLTEGAQETIDAAARAFVDDNYDFLSPETRSRILEATASGALVGGVVSGAIPGGRKGKVVEPWVPQEEGKPKPTAITQEEALTLFPVQESPQDEALMGVVRKRAVEEGGTIRPERPLTMEDLSQVMDKVWAKGNEGLPTELAWSELEPASIAATTEDVVSGLKEKGLPLFAASEVLPASSTLQGVIRPAYWDIQEKGLPEETLLWTLGRGSITLAKLKPGEVGFITGTEQVRPGLAMASLARALHRALAPNTRLIVSTKPTWARETVGGFYTTLRDGGHFIWLNKDRSPLTLVHEFGHLSMWEAFRKAPLTTQVALYQKWADKMRALDGKSVFEIMMALRNPEVVKSWLWADKAKGLELPPSFINWFDFHEFIAEQIARWGGQKGGIVEKYFKDSQEALYKVLEEAKKNGIAVDVSPAEFVGGWLDSLYRQPRTGVALAEQIVGEAVEKSSRENAKALGLDPNMPFEELIAQAPPASPASRSIAATPGVSSAIKAGVDKYNWWTRLTWTLFQHAAENPHVVPIQRYTEITRSWNIERMRWMSRADTRIKEWRALGPDMGRRLSTFLFDVDSMSYLKPGENMRWPTVAELQAIAKKHGIDRRAGELYLRIRDDFLAFLSKVEEAWVKDAMNSIADPTVLALRLAELRGEIASLKSRPYFPHMRFGDYSLLVKDGAGKKVSFQQFATQRETQNALTEARALYGPTHSFFLDKLPEDIKVYRGVPPAVLNKLRSTLKLTPTQNDWLDNFIFELSPANSAAKRFKRRTNLPGFSSDALRSYAAYFFTGANHIGRLLYGADLQQSVDDIRESRKTLSSLPEVAKRQNFADWYQRHLDYNMNPGNEWSALRSLAFQFHLGFALDSAFINLLQLPMVAGPHLGAQYGEFPALGALGRNARWAFKLRDGKAVTHNSAKEQAIALGIEHSFLNEAQAKELAAASEGGALGRMIGGSALQRGILEVGYWGGWAFSEIEKAMRRVVFTSAYDLALEAQKDPKSKGYNFLQSLRARNPQLMADLLNAGWLPENAVAFLAGRDAVEQTMLEYARFNRPEFMRGKKSVLFTFYMFQQGMLWFFKHSPGGTRALVTLLAASGLMGLPGAGDIDDLLRFIAAELFGKQWRASDELRKMLVEFTERPDLILEGLGRDSFGLAAIADAVGVPMPSVDFSRRLGFGQVVPGLHALLAQGGVRGSFEERLGNTTKDILGATFGTGLSIVKALSSESPREFRFWEGILPRAFRNAVRALHYSEEGVRTRSGAQLLPPFDVTDTKTAMEVAAQALGFTPTKVAAKWDLVGAQREVQNYWELRRAELLREFDVTRRDAETRRDVMERIRAYNKESPPKARISPDTLRQSLHSRQRSRTSVEKMLGVGAREVAKRYPELAPELPSRP